MILNNIGGNIRNMLGWKTDRRIIVIESDDWGTVRMPSNQAFEKLQTAGIDLLSHDGERYNRYDNLATESDLANLFEVLSGIRDINGGHGVLTPMSIMANPDFEKIEKEKFQSYHYELFTDTLKKYMGCEKAFELWQQGIRERLFVPQLHGREHLNVSAWMRALQSGDKQTRIAFKEGVWSFVPAPDSPNAQGYLAAFELFDPSEITYHRTVIKEATEIFEKIFQYKAEVFVPPNFTHNNALNDTLMENGIRFKDAGRVQLESLGKGRVKKVYNFRHRSRSGIWYLFRNAWFEPNMPGKDWVSACLSEIDSAFRWKQPAIISAHRTNFVGSLDIKNRDRSLVLLKELLQSAQKRWANIEFMTSAELGKLMKGEE
jgi:hypothetical protein